NRVSAVGRRLTLRGAVRNCCRREDNSEETGQLPPLLVLAAATHGEGERLQPLQRLDLSLQLRDGPRRGGLVEDLLLGSRDLLVGCILQVIDVFGVERRSRGGQGRSDVTAALKQLQLAQAAFEPLAPSPQRLVDRFRG